MCFRNVLIWSKNFKKTPKNTNPGNKVFSQILLDSSFAVVEWMIVFSDACSGVICVVFFCFSCTLFNAIFAASCLSSQFF